MVKGKAQRIESRLNNLKKKFFQGLRPEHLQDVITTINSNYLFVHSSYEGMLCECSWVGFIEKLGSDSSFIDCFFSDKIDERIVSGKFQRLPGEGGELSFLARKFDKSCCWNLPHRIVSLKGAFKGAFNPGKKWSLEKGYGELLDIKTSYLVVGLNVFFLPTVFHVMEALIVEVWKPREFHFNDENQKVDYPLSNRRVSKFNILRLKRFLARGGHLEAQYINGVRVEIYNGISRDLLIYCAKSYKVYSF